MDHFLIDKNSKRIVSHMNYEPDQTNLPEELVLKEAPPEHITLFNSGFGMYDLENNTPVKNTIQSKSELQAFLNKKMDSVLNDFAHTNGYSNFVELLSYGTSQNAMFKEQADLAVLKRDDLRAQILTYVNSRPFEFSITQEEALASITW